MSATSLPPPFRHFLAGLLGTDGAGVLDQDGTCPHMISLLLVFRKNSRLGDSLVPVFRSNLLLRLDPPPPPPLSLRCEKTLVFFLESHRPHRG